MPAFTELNTPKGLSTLNVHLGDRSYIDGYTPSQSDVEVFNQIPAVPEATKAPFVSRWWNHINSYGAAERATWSKVGQQTTSAAAPAAAKKDDDFDLFGDEEEEDDEAYQAEVSRRAKEITEKKKASGKEIPIARSVVVIDVKPWEDTTDMKLLEEGVRAIAMEGLEWKASKLVPMAYGIKKLQISAHIVDDKVSTDDLQEAIQELSDYVQSTDIAQFSKL